VPSRFPEGGWIVLGHCVAASTRWPASSGRACTKPARVPGDRLDAWIRRGDYGRRRPTTRRLAAGKRKKLPLTAVGFGPPGEPSSGPGRFRRPRGPYIGHGCGTRTHGVTGPARCGTSSTAGAATAIRGTCAGGRHRARRATRQVRRGSSTSRGRIPSNEQLRIPNGHCVPPVSEGLSREPRTWLFTYGGEPRDSTTAPGRSSASGLAGTTRPPVRHGSRHVAARVEPGAPYSLGSVLGEQRAKESRSAARTLPVVEGTVNFSALGDLPRNAAGAFPVAMDPTSDAAVGRARGVGVVRGWTCRHPGAHSRATGVRSRVQRS